AGAEHVNAGARDRGHLRDLEVVRTPAGCGSRSEMRAVGTRVERVGRLGGVCGIDGLAEDRYLGGVADRQVHRELPPGPACGVPERERLGRAKAGLVRAWRDDRVAAGRAGSQPEYVLAVTRDG